jgi:SAM-dependent methyltransferase
MDSTETSKAIGRHWSEVAPTTDSSGRVLKVRWWQHAPIIRHINRNVCGKPVDGFSEGLNLHARGLLEGRMPLQVGISVGCGNGMKEMKLLKHGIVRSFDLFELAESRIAAGRELAKKQGFEKAVRFIRDDAFQRASEPEQYDLVHWNNSLHHMLNVEEAVEWSWRVLKPGGLFYMDDFVGPDRFQWTPLMLLAATAVRQTLPSRFLANPRDPKTMLCRVMQKVDAEKLRQSDPSEAADSSRILTCLRARFPGAEVILTGGVIYHLALSEILAHFTDEEDQPLLERLLAVDDLCTAMGETHYAVALALKS